MPSNQTPNYQLSQWVKSDQVRMEDFNADNAKIDAALKAESDARIAADSAALARFGNCQMWVYTYTGNGQYGESHPNRVTFPQKPALIIMMDSLLRWSQIITPEYSTFNCGNTGTTIRWSGNTMSYFSNNVDSQLNASGRTYNVFAFWPR